MRLRTGASSSISEAECTTALTAFLPPGGGRRRIEQLKEQRRSGIATIFGQVIDRVSEARQVISGIFLLGSRVTEQCLCRRDKRHELLLARVTGESPTSRARIIPEYQMGSLRLENRTVLVVWEQMDNMSFGVGEIIDIHVPVEARSSNVDDQSVTDMRSRARRRQRKAGRRGRRTFYQRLQEGHRLAIRPAPKADVEDNLADPADAVDGAAQAIDIARGCRKSG